MFGELDLNRECQPYFIHRRVALISSVEYVIHPIDYGFWYLLRKIVVKYPEYDVTGLIYGPKLRIELFQRAQNKLPQNVPIPDDLFCTPGSNNVRITLGGQMTASSPTSAKLQNIVYPFRDGIELRLYGQNGVTPTFAEIVFIGYLVPADRLHYWKGSYSG